MGTANMLASQLSQCPGAVVGQLVLDQDAAGTPLTTADLTPQDVALFNQAMQDYLRSADAEDAFAASYTFTNGSWLVRFVINTGATGDPETDKQRAAVVRQALSRLSFADVQYLMPRWRPKGGEHNGLAVPPVFSASPDAMSLDAPPSVAAVQLPADLKDGVRLVSGLASIPPPATRALDRAHSFLASINCAELLLQCKSGNLAVQDVLQTVGEVLGGQGLPFMLEGDLRLLFDPASPVQTVPPMAPTALAVALSPDCELLQRLGVQAVQRLDGIPADVRAHLTAWASKQLDGTSLLPAYTSPAQQKTLHELDQRTLHARPLGICSTLVSWRRWWRSRAWRGTRCTLGTTAMTLPIYPRLPFLPLGCSSTTSTRSWPAVTARH